jgi:hypothetical protein
MTATRSGCSFTEVGFNRPSRLARAFLLLVRVWKAWMMIGMSQERTLKPIADEESHILAWHCSNCAWKLGKPAQPTAEMLQVIQTAFDEHDCRGFVRQP